MAGSRSGYVFLTGFQYIPKKNSAAPVKPSPDFAIPLPRSAHLHNGSCIRYCYRYLVLKIQYRYYFKKVLTILKKEETLEYRPVLGVLFYHILPIPEVPLDPSWGQPVGDVPRLFTKIQKFKCRKGPRSAIKLNGLYCTTWPFSGGQLPFFGTKRVATSLSLFCPSVPQLDPVL